MCPGSAFRSIRRRTLITSGFSGTLGAGFPTALGVKVGQPNRPVVAVTGDGGFLFGGSDLATAVRYGINLVTILFNNESYGNVLRDQRRLFEGRESGSALSNPDFQTYAKAFGVPILAGHRCRRAARRADRGAGGERADADRGDDRHHQGILAVGVHLILAGGEGRRAPVQR